MATITVNIAGRGTPLAEGGASATGHMWFTLDPGDGSSTESRGFAPDATHQGQPFAPGEVHKNDEINYTQKYDSITFQISREQYERVRDFANDPTKYGFNLTYNGINNSCIDFTWAALKQAGFNPADFNGALWPAWNKDYIHDQWDRYMRTHIMEDAASWDADIRIDGTGRVTVLPICKPPIRRPSTNINTNWRAAISPPRRDPLAIDLDADGIETLGIPASGTPILFDHDADGIKTGTGWLKSDDAWLVLDRDNNGSIDSGRELFGVDTLITVTERLPYSIDSITYTRSARTGFEALGALDKGNGAAGSACP